MLTIKKHPLSPKAAMLGTIAFLIGLSGAAMYIDRFRQHENLVFGQAEMVLGASDTRSAEQKSPATKAQDADSSQSTASPQIASGSRTLAPVPASSPMTSTPPATSSTATTTPYLAPGMGAGPTADSAPTPPAPSAPTPPVAPNPIEVVRDSCLVNNCIITTVEDTLTP